MEECRPLPPMASEAAWSAVSRSELAAAAWSSERWCQRPRNAEEEETPSALQPTSSSSASGPPPPPPDSSTRRRRWTLRLVPGLVVVSAAAAVSLARPVTTVIRTCTTVE